jgi:hypothetical protein
VVAVATGGQFIGLQECEELNIEAKLWRVEVNSLCNEHIFHDGWFYHDTLNNIRMWIDTYVEKEESLDVNYYFNKEAFGNDNTAIRWKPYEVKLAATVNTVDSVYRQVSLYYNEEINPKGDSVGVMDLFVNHWDRKGAVQVLVRRECNRFDFFDWVEWGNRFNEGITITSKR